MGPLGSLGILGARGPAKRARRAHEEVCRGPRSGLAGPMERSAGARGAGPQAHRPASPRSGPAGPRARGGSSEPDRGGRGREIRRPKKGTEKHFFTRSALDTKNRFVYVNYEVFWYTPLLSTKSGVFFQKHRILLYKNDRVKKKWLYPLLIYNAK